MVALVVGALVILSILLVLFARQGIPRKTRKLAGQMRADLRVRRQQAMTSDAPGLAWASERGQFIDGQIVPHLNSDQRKMLRDSPRLRRKVEAIIDEAAC